MVNPRDIAGNAEEEEEEGSDRFIKFDTLSVALRREVLTPVFLATQVLNPVPVHGKLASPGCGSGERGGRRGGGGGGGGTAHAD